jgi:DNA-binding XRE family transcriptional regulator
MKKGPEFDADVRQAIESDPEFAAEYFAELSERPLPVQLSILRKYLGVTQEKLSQTLNCKQTHISRLEKEGSDHRISAYRRAAERLGARLVMIPSNMVLVPKSHWRKVRGAHARA